MERNRIVVWLHGRQRCPERRSSLPTDDLTMFRWWAVEGSTLGSVVPLSMTPDQMVLMCIGSSLVLVSMVDLVG